MTRRCLSRCWPGYTEHTPTRVRVGVRANPNPKPNPNQVYLTYLEPAKCLLPTLTLTPKPNQVYLTYLDPAKCQPFDPTLTRYLNDEARLRA